MILQLDMGNTRIKWRLRKDSSIVARGSVPSAEDFASLAKDLSKYHIQRILAVSVLCEELNRALMLWAEKEFGLTPQFALSESQCGDVVNGYQEPGRLGVDRWLAIIAGFARTRSACVIADCGSAITVDLLDDQGVHLGGYIAPGVAMMRCALAVGTHAVKVSDPLPDTYLRPGRNTDAAVAAAQQAMMVGLVQNAIHQLMALTPREPQLLITGGDAQWLTRTFKDALVVPDLVFEGLELAFSCK